MLAITLDGDMVSHLAVALRRHRSALRQHGLAEPPQLADLEAMVVEIVSKQQQASRAITAPVEGEDGPRDYLTRHDVHRIANVSLSTVDRWIGSGKLPSSKHGRIRRVTRADLAKLLSAAA